jgi:hypothetical protein
MEISKLKRQVSGKDAAAYRSASFSACYTSRVKPFRTIRFFLWVLLLAPSLFAQDDLRIVVPATDGRPALLMADDGSGWGAPISVYSDSDVEMFISKSSVTANVFWDINGFTETGSYVVSIYSYYKNDHTCRKWLANLGRPFDPALCAEIAFKRRSIAVDMQKKIASFVSVVLVDKDGEIEPATLGGKTTTIKLSDVDPPTAQALTTISGIFLRASHDPELAAERAAQRQQAEIVKKMAQQTFSHACSTDPEA